MSGTGNPGHPPCRKMHGVLLGKEGQMWKLQRQTFPPVPAATETHRFGYPDRLKPYEVVVVCNLTLSDKRAFSTTTTRALQAEERSAPGALVRGAVCFNGAA